MKRSLTVRALSAAAALMLLLTGCAGASSAPESSLSSAADSVQTAETPEQTAPETSAPEQTSETQNHSETDAQTEAQTDAPQTTESAAEQPDADAAAAFLQSRETVALRGRACINAPDGLRMRKEPDTSSGVLATCRHRSEITVTGFRLTDSPEKPLSCWLAVEANGKSGYVCADYAAVQITERPDALSARQKAALGVLMLHQSERLWRVFTFRGGLSAAGTGTESDDNGYCRLRPDGLTLSRLKQEACAYFTEQFSDSIAGNYDEHDGTLWAIPEVPDNPAFDYQTVTALRSEDGGTLTFALRYQWNVPDDAEFWDQPEDGEFSLIYEDGVWKTADYILPY